LPDSKYVQPDAANFNSWRRHIKLSGTVREDILFAWEGKTFNQLDYFFDCTFATLH